jgi:hypothetical protein
MIRMDNITYPVKLCDVEKINNMNPKLNINVFGYESTKSMAFGQQSRKLVPYCVGKDYNNKY